MFRNVPIRHSPYVDGPLLARCFAAALIRSLAPICPAYGALAQERWPRWFPRREFQTDSRPHSLTVSQAKWRPSTCGDFREKQPMLQPLKGRVITGFLQFVTQWYYKTMVY